MANAKKLKSGNWRVLAYVGKHVTKSGYKSFTAPTKKEAERLAAAFIPEDTLEAESNITVGQAIDDYIAMKDAVLSPSTIRAYKKIRRVDMQGLMELPVSQLTGNDVQRVFNEEAKSKSPKTLRNAHGLLCSALRMARPEFRLDTTLPQKEKPSIKIPTREEIRLLLEAADPELSLCIRLAAMLGLRRSEICALTLQDFDLSKGTVTINKAVVLNDAREWVVKPPKSYSGNRTLTIPKTLCAILQSLAQDAVTTYNPNMLTSHFEALQKRCFGEIRYRFHDLRHYNASVMLALGVPNKYAMERMGHATDNMLKAVYQHTMQDKQKEIAEQLNRFFDEASV